MDLMLTLFPFETEYYRQQGIPVAFVGHPLAETLTPSLSDEAFRSQFAEPGQRLIAVLPGSRVSEVKRLGRVFAETAVCLNERFPNLGFVAPMASDSIRRLFESQCEGLQLDNLKLVAGQSQRALTACDFAILASGTAALEAGLLAKPMLVAYRISSLGYWYVRRTLTVDHASMPNHLIDSHPVPEFIHDQVAVENLCPAAASYLADAELMQKTSDELAQIHPMLHRDSGGLACAALSQLLV